MTSIIPSTSNASVSGIIHGFKIHQDTIENLPTPIHRRVAQKLIEDGIWVLVPTKKA